MSDEKSHRYVFTIKMLVDVGANFGAHQRCVRKQISLKNKTKKNSKTGIFTTGNNRLDAQMRRS